MPTAPLYSDDLLDPISADQPVGSDLRWTPEWDRIREARRADDGLEAGKWAKKDRKVADWRTVQELATALLRQRSKDLQLAMWLTEANLKLHGFPGLRDGLRLTRELIVRYWEKGLYPPMEDGPEDRAGPLQWLNDKLVDVITAIPITKRSDQGTDYSFIDLQDAQRVGSEARWKTPDGDVDDRKKKEYNQAIAEGHISMEMFERALKLTSRRACEELYSDFQQTYAEFKELEKVIDEKFGDEAPVLSACRNALNQIKIELERILERKRMDEPDSSVPPATQEHPDGAATPVVVRIPIPPPANNPVGRAGVGASWQDAEALIRAGEIDKGLAEMTRHAASETSGRNRFQRKLLLAEVCLAIKRERLARSILEELAEQIEKYQLEFWESTELVGSVWSKLYRLYRHSGTGSSDSDKANKLYERLCRLDPWQALSCGE
jgi:type VI secretion system protein ImpA